MIEVGEDEEGEKEIRRAAEKPSGVEQTRLGGKGRAAEKPEGVEQTRPGVERAAEKPEGVEQTRPGVGRAAEKPGRVEQTRPGLGRAAEKPVWVEQTRSGEGGRAAEKPLGVERTRRERVGSRGLKICSGCECHGKGCSEEGAADEQNQGSAFIGTVTSGDGVRSGRWRKLGKGEIVVDSAAEESVCPVEWEKGFEVKAGWRKINLRNASGGKIEHYGSKRVTFKPKGAEDGNRVMGLEFQASGVRKPLAAVWRIAEKGNIVQFGPREGDNFIKNIETEEKIMMKKRGGSYIMEVEFMRKDETFQRQV